MTTTVARLDAIEAQLTAARPGPWLVNDEEQTVRVESTEGGEWGGEIMYDRSAEHPTYWVSEFRPDAVFIAAAPDTIRELLTLARKQAAALEAVLTKCDRAEAYGEYPDADTVRSTILEALGDGDE